MYPYKRIKKYNKDEHRIIMGVTGRNNVVHHIDGNKKNNDKNNLIIMTRGEHLNLHRMPMAKKHPSLSAYNDRGCRCNECKKIKRESRIKKENKYHMPDAVEMV